MFSADVTNRDPAEILLKNTADREFFLLIIKISSSIPKTQIHTADPAARCHRYSLAWVMIDIGNAYIVVDLMAD